MDFKKIHREFGVSLFLLLFTFICTIAYFTTEDNVYNPSIENENIQIEATQIEKLDEGSEIYRLEFEKVDETNNTLLFYTNHQEVYVYLEDELIYSLEKADSIYGRTPGAMWNMISLPANTKQVSVKVVQAYPELTKQVPVFELGNAIHMYREVLDGASIEIILSCTIVVVGIALVLYWLLVFGKLNKQREILYLGFFAVVFGIWNFIETQFAVFMFDNRAFFSYLAFTCLMTMCLPAVFFIKSFLEVEDKFFYKLVTVYIVLEILICQILHLSGVAGVKETANYTMVSIGLILIYLLYAIIKGLIAKNNVRKIAVNIIGLVVLAVTAVIDISSYYTNVLTAVKVAKIGFLVYAVLLGYETTRVARERLQEEQRMELLKEMAVKDLLTGCFNRNAYSEDVSKLKSLEGIQVVGFDLNDLKKCNDTKGHKAGDIYIQDAASMIQKLFGAWGKVYRIGGDEFCIITKDISEAEYEKMKSLLALNVAHYNLDHPDSGFGIACGYATYDSKLDKDIEAIRHRADLSMYENKKEIKK